MPLIVLSPTVNEQVSPAIFPLHAVTGGGGRGGGGRHARGPLFGRFAQAPVKVLSPTVTVHASPAAFPLHAWTSSGGGGGRQTRMFRPVRSRQFPSTVLPSMVN